MKDSFSEYDLCECLVAVVATATKTSGAVDLSKYGSSTCEFILGQSGDTLSGSVLWTLTLTECDTVGGSYTAVADAEVIDGTTSPSNSIVVDAAAEDEFTYRLGYIGNARFIKMVATATGTHTTGTPMAMQVNLGHPRMAKAAQQSVAIST